MTTMAQRFVEHSRHQKRFRHGSQLTMPPGNQYVLSDCLHVTQKVIVNQNSNSCKTIQEAPGNLTTQPRDGLQREGVLPYSTEHQSWRLPRQKRTLKTTVKRTLHITLPIRSDCCSSNEIDSRTNIDKCESSPRSEDQQETSDVTPRPSFPVTSPRAPSALISSRSPRRSEMSPGSVKQVPQSQSQPIRRNSFTVRGLGFRYKKGKLENDERPSNMLSRREPFKERASAAYDHTRAICIKNETVCQENYNHKENITSQQVFSGNCNGDRFIRKTNTRATNPKLWQSRLPSGGQVKTKEGACDVRSKTSTGHYPTRAVALFKRCTKSARFIRRPVIESTPSSSQNAHVLLEVDRKHMSRRLEEIMYGDNLPKFRESLSSFLTADRKRIVDYKETSTSLTVFFRACTLSKMPFVDFMLVECRPDLELTSQFILHDQDSAHMVTPLWYAAATGNLPLLRRLKEAGSDIDACSDTGSAAVLAACHMSHIDVVKYLLLNKVNLHVGNSKGLTCLISAVHSVDLVRLLVLNGAEINKADFLGNTAMHYAAEDDRLMVIRILHELGGNPLQTNNDGYTVIQTAAKHRHREIMEFLIQTSSSMKLESIINAYELYASMVILLDYEFEAGYSYFFKATVLRFMNKSNIICKMQNRTSELGQLENIREFNTPEDLLQYAGNPDDLTMQALLVLERQRGGTQENYLQLLMHSGATFADRMDFMRAANLWKLSYTLRYRKYISRISSCPEPLNQQLVKTSYSVVKLLCQWKREDSMGFDFRDEDDYGLIYHRIPEHTMREILLIMCDHTAVAQQYLMNTKLIACDKHHPSFSLLLSSLLCVLVTYLNSYSRSERHESIWRRIQTLIYSPVRDKAGHTLLHVSVLPNTLQILELDFLGLVMDWPSVAIVDILLLLGADPTAVDETGSTPLHLVASHYPEGLSSAKVVIESLLAKGCHPDQFNSLGQTAVDLLPPGELKQWVSKHVTLKCLAARAIKKHNIAYLNEIPSTLYSFVELHENIQNLKYKREAKLIPIVQ